MADNDKPGLKKFSWRKEVDAKLVAYFKKYDHSDWRQIPKFTGSERWGKSYRLHWVNYWHPSLKRGNYTQEEEQKIIKLHQSLGDKWNVIAERFPGRIANDIKIHWHTHLKKRLDYGEMASEFMVKHSNTFEGEMNHYAETENSVIFGDASSNNLETSISPLFTKKINVEQEVEAQSTMNWPGKNTCSEDSSHIPINGASQDSSLKTMNGANGGDTSRYSDGRTDSEGGSGPS